MDNPLSIYTIHLGFDNDYFAYFLDMMSISVNYIKGEVNILRKHLHMHSTCCYKVTTELWFDLVLIKWGRIALIKQQTLCQLGYQFREFFCL